MLRGFTRSLVGKKTTKVHEISLKPVNKSQMFGSLRACGRLMATAVLSTSKLTVTGGEIMFPFYPSGNMIAGDSQKSAPGQPTKRQLRTLANRTERRVRGMEKLGAIEE